MTKPPAAVRARHSAPLLFLDRKHTERFDPEDLRIDYAEDRNFSKQPLYQGRVLLRPEIDLSVYDPRAVIDWLEIGWDSRDEQRSLNIARKIKNWLNTRGSRSTAHVMGPGRETDYWGNRFVCRIQDPDPAELRELMNFIAVTYQALPFENGRLHVTGLEVSLDFYVTNSAEMAEENRCRSLQAPHAGGFLMF